jgi:glycerophosphoryl diester phosphodiesterase
MPRTLPLRRPIRAVIGTFVSLGVVLAAVVTSAPEAEPAPGVRTQILAHRGIAQRFNGRDIAVDTCTAARMLPPRHAYLENTIGSMRAAFEAGAEIVEFDIHPTTDGQFAVFHDWTLECRTNGRGVTREHSMAELRGLDIGYGYTADGGRSFPFRGRGIGLMPSLDDVLASFPDRQFLINIKSRDRSEGERLAAVLRRLPAERRALLMVYGGAAPVAAVRAAIREIRTTSRPQLEACLVRYVATGWLGHAPEACRHMLVLLPINSAPWLWGWPHALVARMNAVSSHIVLVGPYRGGGFFEGLDYEADLSRVPRGFGGIVMTDDVERAIGILRRHGGNRQPPIHPTIASMGAAVSR